MTDLQHFLDEMRKAIKGTTNFSVLRDRLVETADRFLDPETTMTLSGFIAKQKHWSEQTFGPARLDNPTLGCLNHIKKELKEIEADPSDLNEWIDVIILALDAAWRAGYSPAEIVAALDAKQKKNFSRKWPDWRTFNPGDPIEHDRSAE